MKINHKKIKLIDKKDKLFVLNKKNHLFKI